jgi:hypothetical protein
MTQAEHDLMITLALVVRGLASPDDQRLIDRKLAALQAEHDTAQAERQSIEARLTALEENSHPPIDLAPAIADILGSSGMVVPAPSVAAPSLTEEEIVEECCAADCEDWYLYVQSMPKKAGRTREQMRAALARHRQLVPAGIGRERVREALEIIISTYGSYTVSGATRPAAFAAVYAMLLSYGDAYKDFVKMLVEITGLPCVGLLDKEEGL